MSTEFASMGNSLSGEELAELMRIDELDRQLDDRERRKKLARFRVVDKSGRVYPATKWTKRVKPPVAVVPASACVCGGERSVSDERPGGRKVVCGSCGKAHWQIGWTRANRWNKAA